MSRNSQTFLLILFVIAVVSGALGELIKGLMYIVLGFMFLRFITLVLKKGNSATRLMRFPSMIKTPAIFHLSPDLERAEEEIRSQLGTPGDSVENFNLRFARLIGIGDSSLPRIYSSIVSKKVMYEAERKYGTWQATIWNSNRLTLAEAIRALPASEHSDFAQFCVKVN